MAIPDYAHESCKRFFSRGYVGTGHGDNGSAHKIYFDTSHPELKPTRTIVIEGGRPHCVYCGEIALPIQAGRRHGGDFEVTGLCCVCKDAVAELELMDKVNELRSQFNLAERELIKQFPQPDKKKLTAIRLQKLKEKFNHRTVLMRDIGDTTPPPYAKAGETFWE